MNTVFVSGTLRTPAQLKMDGNGYLLTFDMMNYDETIDRSGIVKQVLTPWSVSLAYDKKPTQLLQRLGQGIKVLVKGNAKIDYKEINEQIRLECELAGQRLDIFEGQVVMDNTSRAASEPAWAEQAAIAS